MHKYVGKLSPESAYWLLPILLVGVQAAFCFRSSPLLRYEEVAESIRNVYWLDQRTIFDGISSNVGWYGLLLLVYKSFGYSMYLTKTVRLIIDAGALISLAILFRRAIGPKLAVLPLLAVGLSPSLLYFNTLQASFGTDLDLLPYGLLLLAGISASSTAPGLRIVMLPFCFGFLLILGAMIYPAFLFYVPVLSLLYLRVDQFRPTGPIAVLCGMATPLIIALVYLKDPFLLINDPVTHSGLFRGGATTVVPNIHVFALNLARIGRDLFWHGRSYYYRIDYPELYGGVGAACFLFVVLAAIRVWRGSLALLIPASACLLVGLSVIAGCLGSGPAGLRRCTILVAGFYALFFLVWRALTTQGLFAARPYLRHAGIVLCMMLPLNSMVCSIMNFRSLRTLDADWAEPWFQVKKTSAESVAEWDSITASGKPLDCRDMGLTAANCRYANIFAAVVGQRRWNGEPETTIRAYDFAVDGFVDLNLPRWESGELLH